MVVSRVSSHRQCGILGEFAANDVVEQYALTEAGALLARFVQRFDKIEPVNLPKNVRKGFGLVSYPKDGVTLRLHEANA